MLRFDNLLLVKYFFLLLYYLLYLFLLCFGRCYPSFCYYFPISLSDFPPLLSWYHSWLLFLFHFLLSHFLYFLHFYVSLFLNWLSYSFFLLQRQSPWYYCHHLTLCLFIVFQFCFAAALLLTYLILFKILDYLHLLQCYFQCSQLNNFWCKLLSLRTIYE